MGATTGLRPEDCCVEVTEARGYVQNTNTKHQHCALQRLIAIYIYIYNCIKQLTVLVQVSLPVTRTVFTENWETAT